MKPCVFVSYSSKDRELARAIHERLKSARFPVWRDELRLEADWSREIAFSLAEQADVLCLLWTHAAANSRWVKHEWLTARALEKYIVPCIFPSGPDLPEPLTTLHGIRFDDVQMGCDRLVERLAATESFQVRYEFRVLPEHSFIPFNPNPEFTGRNAELLDLYLKMVGNLCRIGLNQVGTVGMGGVGKTQLAVEFAFRYSFAFDAVFWIDATDPQGWLGQLLSLSRDRLRLSVADRQSPDSALQHLFALQAHFKQYPDTLLVLDNVEDPKLLNSERALLGAGVTPLSLGADLLFTTRRSFCIPGVVSQAVGVLSQDAAYDLLTAHRKPESEVEAESARAVANAVGYLPLAIVLIAGYLRKLPAVSFSDYRQALFRRRLGNIDLGVISEEELATRHMAAVGATLESQWQAVGRDDARLLLKLGGLFPESAIVPKARLGLLAGIPPGDSPLDRPLDQAFLPIEELNLVELIGDGSRIRLHPLVREFAQGLVKDVAREDFKRTAVESLAAAYDDPLRLQSEWRSRGVDELILDLRTAKSFCDDVEMLTILERVLDRERHHLTQIRVNAPERALQQLHHRAQLMGLPELAKSFLTAYRHSANRSFRTVAARPLEDAAIVRVLKGHRQKVTGAAFCDDTRAVSASWDGSLVLWDLESGEPLRSLRGHSSVINALAVTPDGRLAVSGSDDRTVIVWDLATGEVLRTLHGQNDYVLSVAVSADGGYVVGAARGGQLVYWDLDRGTQVDLSQDAGPEIAMRGDGGLILSRPVADIHEGELLIIDPHSRAERSLRAHGSEITAVAFALEGGRALTAGYDDKLILWDAEAGTQLRLMDTIGSVYNIAFARDGHHALTDCGKYLVYWDLEVGKAVRTFRAHHDYPNCVALSPSGKLAISSAQYEPTLILWDTTAPEVTASSQVHEERVDALCFDKEGDTCASIDWNGHVLVWDAPQGALISSHILEKGVYNSLSWSTRRALTGVGKEAQLQDVVTGDILRTFRLPKDVHALALSSDGRRAFFSLSGRDRTITTLDADSGQEVQPPSFIGYAHFLSLTPDGGQLLVGSDNGLLVLWNLRRDRELVRLEGPPHGDLHRF
jgi:WD40 repeat protein